LLQDGNPQVRNLVEAQKLFSYATCASEEQLVVRPIDLETAVIVAFGDSSWANSEGFESQAGLLVFLCDPRALTPVGGKATLLEWRSHRLRRVCRSTIGAETQAADAALDQAQYLQRSLLEILHPGSRATKKSLSHKGRDAGRLPVHLVTDCKSLYDTLTKLTPPSGIEEKRVAIEICGLREQIFARFVHWVPTSEMVADSLTKSKPPAQLSEFLRLGRVRLAVLKAS